MPRRIAYPESVSISGPTHGTHPAHRRAAVSPLRFHAKAAVLAADAERAVAAVGVPMDETVREAVAVAYWHAVASYAGDVARRAARKGDAATEGAARAHEIAAHDTVGALIDGRGAAADPRPYAGADGTCHATGELARAFADAMRGGRRAAGIGVDILPASGANPARFVVRERGRGGRRLAMFVVPGSTGMNAEGR